MVTREGFNALLKLVEEPPPHLKFVFATTEPDKVIGTIRSRTHHYPFRLIPPGTLQELVEEVLRAEGVPYEPAALPLAVRAGAGSARDTLSILDQLLAGSDEQGITYARAVSLLGYTDSALLDEVIAAFAARDGAAVFAAIDRVIESGQDPRRFTADLLERVRDLVILSNVPEAGGTGLLNVPPDELEQMRRQASSMGPGELTRAADLLHAGLTEMRGATSPRLLLELICARILLPAAYEDEASLYARLDRLERHASQGGGLLVGAPGGFPGGQAPEGSGPPRPQSRQEQSRQEQSRQEQSRQEQSRQEQSPPARGGDPTSSVNRPSGPAVGQPGSVDNGPGRDLEENANIASTASTADPAGGGSAGSGTAGPGTAGPGTAGPGTAGPGTAGSGTAGSGTAGSGTAGPGSGVDVENVRRAWPSVLEAVRQASKVAAIYMDGVQVVSLEGNVLTLAFPNENNRKAFGPRDAPLREVLGRTFGTDWRIETVLAGAESPRHGRSAGRPPHGPAAQGPTSQGPAAGFAGASTPPQPRATTPAAPTRPDLPSPPPPQSAPAARPDPDPVPPPPDDESPPPPEPAPMDESDEVDPEGDADADDSEIEVSGMALIKRELGGEVIREVDNS
jgi:DNA polymerase-3 subunit gamma/tau